MAPFILGTWLLLTFFNLYGIEYVSDGLTVEKTFSQELVQKAENGDPEAQYHLGACYDGGSGVGRDKAKAVEWYKKAAAQGFLKAQFRLGHIYECSACACAKQDCQKCPVKVDMPKSFQWRRKAAEGGMVEAQILLGKRLSEYGSFRDDEEARKWLKKAALNESEEAEQILKTVPSYGRKPFSADLVVKAESGSSEDQLSLGRCYLYGEGVAKDRDSAIKWLEKAAANHSYIEKTKIQAQLLLAEVNSDKPDEAKKWYQAAAKEGDTFSKIKMAEFCLSDYPLSEESKNQAEQWLIEANSEGDPKTSVKLATLYLRHDLNKSKILTLPLLYEAAGKGSGEAAFIIGSLYQDGKIVLQSKEKALEWFQHATQLGYKAANSEIKKIQNSSNSTDFSETLCLAAEAGEQKSQLNLGLAYLNGQGIEADPELAEKWLLKAAEKNDPQACRALAELYGVNKNLPFDPSLSRIEIYSRENSLQWLHESARADNPKAKILLSVLILLDGNRPFQDGSEMLVKKYLEPLAKQENRHAIEILKILRAETPFPFLSEVQEDARKGSPEALCDLGYMYMWGDEKVGIKRDLNKAIENLEESFQKGYKESAEYLHYIFNQLKQNKEEAEKWKLKMSNRKSLIEAEKEEEKKEKESLLHIKKTIMEEITSKYTLDSLNLLKIAALGDSDAQLAIGIYRLEGNLIKNAKTIEWYNKAVENGDPVSAFRLGNAYTWGNYGLKKDYLEAEKLLGKGSANEHAEAQSALGILYFEGKHLLRNQDEGMRLLLKAKENGSISAKEYLKSQTKFKAKSATNPQ